MNPRPSYNRRAAPRKRSAPVKKLIVIVVILGLILGVCFVLLYSQKAKAPDVASSKTTDQTSQTNQTPSFDKKLYSNNDPTSIWVVVNKPRALSPVDYKPADLVFPNVPLRVPGNESMQLRQVTATALEQLFAGAKTAGLNLMLSSGYRSYSYQVNLYGGYVKSMGQAEADKSSARPGHSEHQTGLAADVEPASKKCEVDACFADTPEGQWLAANAYKYGFIIRYTKDKVGVTGYEYEPWHIRYVGTALSTEMHNQGVETLEEFFNLPGGPNY